MTWGLIETDSCQLIQLSHSPKIRQDPESKGCFQNSGYAVLSTLNSANG
jgi:hypothetical protein